MTDLTELAATVAAKRAELIERDARQRDRRSGLFTLRPAIDLLAASVRPVFDAAKAVLLPAGIHFDFEDGWTEMQDKQASELLHQRQIAAGLWPSTASRARSRRYVIALSNVTLGLVRHSSGMLGRHRRRSSFRRMLTW